MKKVIFAHAVFILVLSTMSYPANRYYDKHSDAVKKQHRQDLQNRDAILEALGAFLDEMNHAIKEPEMKISSPVKSDEITGISETEDFHYSGVIIPKIYGYVTTGTLNMRSEDNGRSGIVGKLNFRDKVEIIYQSDITEEINGVRAPWLLVRKSNGDEGWVFGGYISDDMPKEKDKENGKTDWGMIIPAEGRISSRFGKRVDPVSKRSYSFHKGIDIAAPEGTPVYASAEGTIIKAEFVKSGYGNLIIVKHADDIATYYGHLSKIIAKSGDKVKKGELIGKVGSTGRSTGPHLHFEVRRGDKAMDPEGFVR